MKKIVCYALLCYNSKVKSTHLLGLFDNKHLADSVLKIELESNYYHKKFRLYVLPCSLSMKKNLLDNDLLERCYNIANCLYLADRNMFKKNFDNAKYWFNISLDRAKFASLLIHDI